MPSIIADHREARSNIAAMLRERDVDVIVQELPCGDYLLREDFVVERKSASDFVASILDGRMMSQSAMLKANFANVVYLVEGNVFATRSKIQPNALMGALSYLVALQGACIIPSSAPAETAGLLATMARHLSEGLGYQVPLRSGKPKDTRAQAQFLVEGFPGIGPGSAVALLEHFGTIRAILSATEEQLRAVPGIGPKTAKQIIAVLEADTRQAPA